MIGLGWHIGPGGLFDTARTATAQTMQDQESLLLEKGRQQVTREVLEGIAKVRSLDARLALTRKLLEATEKAYQLSRQRGETQVGGVLETLRAEEDLSFARLAYFELVASYNKAQANLRRACGG